MANTEDLLFLILAFTSLVGVLVVANAAVPVVSRFRRSKGRKFWIWRAEPDARARGRWKSRTWKRRAKMARESRRRNRA